jgi:hypothetical protein
MAMRPPAPNAMPIKNDINNEFSRLKSGLFADNLRHAGIFAAIISSRTVDVIARIIIIVSSMLLLLLLLNTY